MTGQAECKWVSKSVRLPTEPHFRCSAGILDFFTSRNICSTPFAVLHQAELNDITRPPNHLLPAEKVNREGIYHWQEVMAFAMAFFNPKAAASKLSDY